MHLLYNGQLILEKDLHLPLTNRAFQYNDGFFETLIVRQGHIRFWKDHVQRMQEASAAVAINFFEHISPKKLQEAVVHVAEQNKAIEHGRIKIKVWRGGGGLYTPQTNDAAWLVTAYPTALAKETPLHINICETIRTLPSALSHIKGPNALLYVMAGLEKKRVEKDDLLLLSPSGAVAELISSNIFWLQAGSLCTPALATGCINGIARRNIQRWAHINHLHFTEVENAHDVLKGADAVFAANVTGVRSIATINGQDIGVTTHELLTSLRQYLFS